MCDGWNAERILLASVAIGDGYWFIDCAIAYANHRTVFGRPNGANQGVQFPLADAYMKVCAAEMMRYKAVRLFDEDKTNSRTPIHPVPIMSPTTS